jgi:hypothetical protein
MGNLYFILREEERVYNSCHILVKPVSVLIPNILSHFDTLVGLAKDHVTSQPTLLVKEPMTKVT